MLCPLALTSTTVLTLRFRRFVTDASGLRTARVFCTTTCLWRLTASFSRLLLCSVNSSCRPSGLIRAESRLSKQHSNLNISGLFYNLEWDQVLPFIKFWKFVNGVLRVQTQDSVEGRYRQRTLTYFIRGSITVQLTSFLTGYDSAALFGFNSQHIYLFGQIKTSQTGGQLYSDTSPFEVSECSLALYKTPKVLPNGAIRGFISSNRKCFLLNIE